MNRVEALRVFEESLEEPVAPGTLKGDEVCDDVDGWNSLAVLSFISAINKRCGVTLQPAKVVGSRKVDDVIDLVVAATAS